MNYKEKFLKLFSFLIKKNNQPILKNGQHVRYENDIKIEEWFENDLLHRLDGPAIEYSNGKKEWFKNGQRHREDGPALIEYRDNKYNLTWFLNDNELSFEAFEKFLWHKEMQKANKENNSQQPKKPKM